MKKSSCPDLDCKLRTKKALSSWVRQRLYAEPDCTVEKAAEQMNMSVLQLKWYLYVVEKKSFSRLRKELRVKDAICLMIMKPDLPVSVIGRLVGEYDRSDFRRNFKSVTGRYPVSRRKRYPLLRLVLFCTHRDLRQVLRRHRLL